MKTLSKIVIQTLRLISFAGYFFLQFFKSNFKLMVDILRINSRISPAIVKINLKSRSETEITLISSLITLTPGTLTISIKATPPTLFVHGMFVRDIEEFKTSLTDLEARMLKAVRFKEFQTKAEK